MQRGLSASRLPAAFPLRGGDLENLVKWAEKSEKYQTDQRGFWKIFRSYSRILDEIRRGIKKKRPKESAATAMPRAFKMRDRFIADYPDYPDWQSRLAAPGYLPFLINPHKKHKEILWNVDNLEGRSLEGHGSHVKPIFYVANLHYLNDPNSGVEFVEFGLIEDLQRTKQYSKELLFRLTY